MADVLTDSLKKILADANLPLKLYWDRQDETAGRIVKVTNLEFIPTGANKFKLYLYGNEDIVLEDIIGMNLIDNIYTSISYTIMAYDINTFEVTLNTVIDRDFEPNEVFDLVVGDTLKIIGFESRYPPNMSNSATLVARKDRYNFILRTTNDSMGVKLKKYTRWLSLLFSESRFPQYDSTGVKIGSRIFNIDEFIQFTEIKSNDTINLVSVGEIRFLVWEDSCVELKNINL